MWFLIVLAILGCALLFPRLWRVLLGTLAAGAVLVSALVLRNQEQERAARSHIAREQVKIADLVLVSDGPGWYRLRGTIHNASPNYTLADLTLKISLEDCDSRGECELIAEQPEFIAAKIAPGQARDFERKGIGSRGLRLKGSLHWGYEVTQVRATE